MTADSPRTPVSYGETVKELQDADAALARIVGQARAGEQALAQIAALTPFTMGDSGVIKAPAIARAVLAGAGVTYNERTAEETSVRTWSTQLWNERGFNIPEGERTVGTGPTAAEHAEIVAHAIQHGWVYRPDSEYHRRAAAALAALVALAEREENRGDLYAQKYDDACALADRQREALLEADALVSKAHDVVWATYPEWEGEAGRREPLNAALWKLHEHLRAVLAGGAGDE